MHGKDKKDSSFLTLRVSRAQILGSLLNGVRGDIEGYYKGPRTQIIGL